MVVDIGEAGPGAANESGSPWSSVAATSSPGVGEATAARTFFSEA